MNLSKLEFLSSEHLKTLLYALKVALHKKKSDVANLCHTILFKNFNELQRWEDSKEDIYLIWLYGLQLYKHHLPEEGKYLFREFTKFCKIVPSVMPSSVAEFARYSLHYLIAIMKKERGVGTYHECLGQIRSLVDGVFSSQVSLKGKNLAYKYVLADLAVSMAMIYACVPEGRASKLSCTFLKMAQFEFLRASSHQTLLDVINSLISSGYQSRDIETFKEVRYILKSIRKQLDFEQFDPTVLLQNVILSSNFSLIHEFCLLFDEREDKKIYLQREPFCLKLYELLELALRPNFSTSSNLETAVQGSKMMQDKVKPSSAFFRFKGIVKMLGLMSCHIEMKPRFEKILNSFFDESCSVLSKKNNGKLFYFRFLIFCSGLLEIIDKHKNIKTYIYEKVSSVLQTCFSQQPELFCELLELKILANVGVAFELRDKVERAETEEAKSSLTQTFLNSVEISLNCEDDRLLQMCELTESNNKNFEYDIFKAKLFINIIKEWKSELNIKQYEVLYLELEKLLTNIKTYPKHNKFDILLYNKLYNLFQSFPINRACLSEFNNRHQLTLKIAYLDLSDKKVNKF